MKVSGAEGSGEWASCNPSCKMFLQMFKSHYTILRRALALNIHNIQGYIYRTLMQLGVPPPLATFAVFQHCSSSQVSIRRSAHPKTRTAYTVSFRKMRGMNIQMIKC